MAGPHVYFTIPTVLNDHIAGPHVYFTIPTILNDLLELVHVLTFPNVMFKLTSACVHTQYIEYNTHYNKEHLKLSPQLPSMFSMTPNS